jgi:uncharacterized protein involved in exopolysaccharide biosynthesis
VTQEDMSQSINLLYFWRVVRKNRLLVGLIVGISVVGAALFTLTLETIYEARAVLIPAGALSKDTTASTLVAMQFGIAPPSSPAATEIVNLLKSNILLEKIIKKHKLAGTFFRSEELSKASEEQLLWESIRYMRTIMKINFTQKDNVIQVAVQFRDPRKSADIVKETLDELNDHMSAETKRVAETNKRYLESQIDKAADPFIRAKIYSLIAQQIETSMMAEAKENFAFKVLDPPKVPDKKIGPKRAHMVIIAFVASLFLSIFVAFIREYVVRARMEDVAMALNSQGREADVR